MLKKWKSIRNKLPNGEVKRYKHPIFEKFEEDLKAYLVIEDNWTNEWVNRLQDENLKNWLITNKLKFTEDFNLRKYHVESEEVINIVVICILFNLLVFKIFTIFNSIHVA